MSYYIEWGDGDITDWTGFQSSGEPYSENHTWATKGTYIIKAKAKDPDGLESEWSELKVIMPHSYKNQFWWFNGMLDRFPLLQRLLEGLVR